MGLSQAGPGPHRCGACATGAVARSRKHLQVCSGRQVDPETAEKKNLHMVFFLSRLLRCGRGRRQQDRARWWGFDIGFDGAGRLACFAINSRQNAKLLNPRCTSTSRLQFVDVRMETFRYDATMLGVD